MRIPLVEAHVHCSDITRRVKTEISIYKGFIFNEVRDGIKLIWKTNNESEYGNKLMDKLLDLLKEYHVVLVKDAVYPICFESSFDI